MTFTVTQQKVLAILPKVVGFPSMVLNSIIVFLVLRDKSKRANTYHRLICGISFSDMISSFFFALSTWPIPSKSTVPWSVGTTATCSIQGFFVQFAVTGSLYNASLSVYYVLVIRRNWKDNDLAKIEPFLHAIPLLWGLGTATSGVILKLYNSANLWCFIAPYPSNCLLVPDVPCIRGEHADMYRWLFFYGPLWVMILIISMNLIAVYLHVRRIEVSNIQYSFAALHASTREDKSDDGIPTDIYGFGEDAITPRQSTSRNESIESKGERYDDNTAVPATSGSITCTGNTEKPTIPLKRSESQESSTMGSTTLQRLRKSMGWQHASKLRRTKEVALQSSLYAASFYVTWTVVTTVRLFQAIQKDVPYGLFIAAAIMTPSQGIPNFVVYLYPRFNKIRKDLPNETYWRWLCVSLSRPDYNYHNNSGS